MAVRGQIVISHHQREIQEPGIGGRGAVFKCLN